MNGAFGRRLFLLTVLEIAAVLWLLVAGLGLFAFGLYADALKTDLNATTTQTVAALRTVPMSAGVDIDAQAVMLTPLRYGVVVIVIDDKQRDDVYRATRADLRPTILRARRAELGPYSDPAGTFAKPILGLATAFGLQPVHAHVGDIDVIVRTNDVALVDATQAFLLPFFLALVAVTLISIAAARGIAQQALRPLVEVQAALERFASGNVKADRIDSRHGSLGSLAAAYNAAMEQMERSFAERERANASMRQFIADAGHQLRTPLTVLRGFIGIMRKGELRTPEDSARILETMHRQAALMGSLVDKLMLLDRWEEDHERAPAEPIDVARLVEDVVTPIAEAQPERTVVIDAPGPQLSAIDPTALMHAVTNIVDNALKYTAGAVRVIVERAGSRIYVKVIDDGPGMEPDEVRHAFDRFYRGARRDVDGTGLGLAIARRAVERAGGNLDLRSTREAGSTFTIALPASSAPIPRPGPVPALR